MNAACDVVYDRGTTERPAYVDSAFAGKCKVFPKPLPDGREPRFLSYQAAWIYDDHLAKISEKSRQIGWTLATAYRIARRHAEAGYKLDTWGTSRDDMQAMLAVQDCMVFAKVFDAGARDLGMQVLDDKGSSGHVIAFSNGTKYYSLSSNPDAQAGKRGNREGDEFALNPKNRQLYAIMEPGITWGGQIELFSTHRGTTNYHNQLIVEAREKGNPKNWHVYRATLQDALDCGFLFKLQKKLQEMNPSDTRLEMDEAAYFLYVKNRAANSESFNQEYMCIPEDEASAFITYDLLDGCKYAPGVAWEVPLAKCGELYAGVDVGQADRFVIWVIEKVSGLLLTRRVLEMKGASWEAMEAEMYAMLDLPNMHRLCVDYTGIGRQFGARAQKRYGSRVELVTFTGAVKEDLAYSIRARMEDRTFRIPDDPVIFADFRGIRKETTTAGNIRFAGEKTALGHSDRFWAAALAVHAEKQPVGFFMPCSLSGGSSDADVSRYFGERALTV
jgi:phage FluMu gp28-like protein